MFQILSVAAATAVVGYDLMDADSQMKQSSKARILTGVALKGSAAAGDTKVRIKIDTVDVVTLFNTNTGVPNKDDVMAVDSRIIPPNCQIHAYVEDAPSTNPIYLAIETDDYDEDEL